MENLLNQCYQGLSGNQTKNRGVRKFTKFSFVISGLLVQILPWAPICFHLRPLQRSGVVDNGVNDRSKESMTIALSSTGRDSASCIISFIPCIKFAPFTPN